VSASTGSSLKKRKASRKRRFVFRLIAVSVAAASSLVIGELVVLLSGMNNDFRMASSSEIIPRPGGPYELLPHGFVPHASIRYTYATNPRGYFDQQDGITHVFNSEGWRDSEHNVEKPADVIRILGLGDSYTFGQGVKREQLFLTLLGPLLEKQIDKKQIETINTGQPGYNTVMQKQLLERRGLDYHPDVVLLSFVPNDVESDIYTDRPKVEFFTEYTTSYAHDDWLSQYSELWTLGRRKFLQFTTADSYLQESIDSYLNEPQKWGRCRDALTEIRDLCRQNDCKLAIAIFPFFVNLNGEYPFQPIHDHVRSFCEKADIPVLDLRDHFRNFDGPELWVHPTDQHPNEQAHQIVAERISDFLVEKRLVP
jgi:lysophospholipase L1-like esterase